MRSKIVNHYRGFTLLEVLIALFVFTIGILGAFLWISRTTSLAATPGRQLVATYLAQEALEIVRNIRDTNFLEIQAIQAGFPIDWREGLLGCETETGCEADYDDSILTAATGPLRLLLLDSNGYYNYDSGNETLFTRKITVTPQEDDKVEIVAEVSWQEKGINHKRTAATELYNWLNPL